MERLILFRHGEAERQSRSGEDFDRRLNARGEEETAAVSRTLAEYGLAPDLAVVSPAARALGTWTAASPAFPAARMELDPSLYHAEAGEIRRVAEQAGAGARTVMVVGHNPGLHDLALRLLIEGATTGPATARVQRSFPTGAAIVFLIDAAGRPAFDGFFPPRG